MIVKEAFSKARVSMCVPMPVFMCSKGQTKSKPWGISRGNETFSEKHCFFSGIWTIYNSELLQSSLR